MCQNTLGYHEFDRIESLPRYVLYALQCFIKSHRLMPNAVDQSFTMLSSPNTE